MIHTVWTWFRLLYHIRDIKTIEYWFNTLPPRISRLHDELMINSLTRQLPYASHLICQTRQKNLSKRMPILFLSLGTLLYSGRSSISVELLRRKFVENALPRVSGRFREGRDPPRIPPRDAKFAGNRAVEFDWKEILHAISRTLRDLSVLRTILKFRRERR